MIKTRVVVNGAQGKMGQLACLTLDAHPEFTLVGRLGRQDDLADALKRLKPEVVVDLTRADCVYNNARIMIEAGVYPVIGASGLLEADIELLRQSCEARGRGGIVVPNFSISAVLMMQCVARVARFLPQVEIIEAHHPQKADAPSGTSIKTADMIADARCTDPVRAPCKEVLAGALGAMHRGVPIHSIRLPGVLAQQSVIFGNQGETLTLSHNTGDRSSFMPGLILACQRVTGFKTLYYGLETLL